MKSQKNWFFYHQQLSRVQATALIGTVSAMKQSKGLVSAGLKKKLNLLNYKV